MTSVPEKNLRILVVDDNRSIHDDFRKILCSRVDSDLDDVEAALFESPKTHARRPLFEVDSAFQGQDGLALVQQSVEHGTDSGGVAQYLAPVLDRAIGRNQGTGAFVTPHDNLQQILGCGERKLSHAEVINDEQRDRSQREHKLFSRAGRDSISEIIEQDVCFAIDHSIALHNDELPDGLGQMAFPGTAWAQKQRIFMFGNETTGSKIED